MNRRNIQRLAMATAMLLAVNINADAQLGGLLNKAKKVATDIARDGVQSTVQQQIGNAQADMVRQRDVEKKLKELRQERAPKEKAKQDEEGQTGNLPIADERKGDVDFFYFSGMRCGIYHTKAKTFEHFVKNGSNWETRSYSFKDNGQVIFEGEKPVGLFKPDGTLNSAKTEGISLDNENFVYWNGKKIGSVSRLGEVYLGNWCMTYSYSPTDSKIAAYITFCIYMNKDLIQQGLAEQKKLILTPGSLNAEHHDAALISIKRRFPAVQDVVITSNEWRVIRDNLGNIISRACDGWYIIKNGNGRRAISYCWRQKYLGGGQYDKLEESAANGFDPIDLD